MAEAEKPSVWVQFFLDSVQDEAASLAQGRAVFADVEMVRIKWPADGKRELVAPANDRSDRPEYMADGSKIWPKWSEAFPRHYELFKRGFEQVDGTPLSALSVVTPARRDELRAQNIVTVEQLAGVDGIALQKLGMHARALKTAAQEYLERAAGADMEARLRDEIARRDDEMEALKAQIADMAASRSPVQAAAPPADVDQDALTFFEELEDDDLRNFLRDAKKEFGNRAGRQKLIELCMAANEDAKRAARERAAA